MSVPQQNNEVAHLGKHEATAAAALWQVKGSTIRCVGVDTSMTASVMVASAFVGDVAEMKFASSKAAILVPIDSSKKIFEAAIPVAVHCQRGAMVIHQLKAVIEAVPSMALA
jgi:hypothetical protein